MSKERSGEGMRRSRGGRNRSSGVHLPLINGFKMCDFATHEAYTDAVSNAERPGLLVCKIDKEQTLLRYYDLTIRKQRARRMSSELRPRPAPCGQLGGV